MQLKNGRSVTALTVRGDTEEEARSMAKAVAGMWQGASSDEKETLKKMLAGGNALEYLTLNEKKLREFLQQKKDSLCIIRSDAKGMYHIIHEKRQLAEEEEKNEAAAISQLRKRQAETEMNKKEKGQSEAPKKRSKKDIAQVVQEEMQPFLEGMYHDLKKMQSEVNELKLKEEVMDND